MFCILGLNTLLFLHTGFVMKDCITCCRPFRTYIPCRDTVMSDGSSFFYSTPQDECPGCDQSNWGWRWNLDLFPELDDKNGEEKL